MLVVRKSSSSGESDQSSYISLDSYDEDYRTSEINHSSLADINITNDNKSISIPTLGTGNTPLTLNGFATYKKSKKQLHFLQNLEPLLTTGEVDLKKNHARPSSCPSLVFAAVSISDVSFYF